MPYVTVPSEQLVLIESPKPGRDFGFHHFKTLHGKTVTELAHEVTQDSEGRYWSRSYQYWKDHEGRLRIV